MFGRISFLTLLLAAIATAQTFGDDPVANERCFGCRGKRNHKDLYSHPTDCHKYYQCFYSGEEGKAIGIERDCPAGSFWNEIILTCVPEGATPCEDRCSNDQVNLKGCYADPSGNCASYFVCSQWTSYPFCCPAKTAFNAETCQCDDSETCKDECVRKAVDPPTTVEPVQVFDDFCIDSWGNKIQPDADQDFFYLVHDDASTSRVKCASGSRFSKDKCACSVNVELPQQPKFRQCTHYMPFDDSENDHSIHNYFVDLIAPARITSETFARGSGSLRTGDGGHIELPYKKGIIHNPRSISFCYFFKCANPPCTGPHASYRDNRDPSKYRGESIRDGNVLQSEHSCQPVGDITAQVPLPQLPGDAPGGFYHICAIGNDESRRLYVNKELVFDEPAADCANLTPLACPWSFGFDPLLGSFDGYLDELLECSYDISEEGILAHYNGKAAMQNLGMIP